MNPVVSERSPTTKTRCGAESTDHSVATITVSILFLNMTKLKLTATSFFSLDEEVIENESQPIENSICTI